MKKPLFTVGMFSAALLLAQAAGFGFADLVVSATSNNSATGNNTQTVQPVEDEDDSYLFEGEEPSDEPLIVAVDWSAISQDIGTALQLAANSEEKNVEVLAGTGYTVPADVINNLVGGDAVLMLQTGNGLAFSLSGQDMRQGVSFSMDMSFETAIPDAVKATVVNGSDFTREFSVKNKANFGFKTDVHVGLGVNNAGKVATLYSYNESKGTMVRAGSFTITKEGRAMFAMTSGGEYVVTVTR